MKPTFIKAGAVFGSLVLASSFVWYQSLGKTRVMAGAKSSPSAEAAAPSAGADGEPKTLSPEDEAQIRKELMFSSKSGGIFTPDDTAIAATAAKTRPAPAPEPEADVYVNGGGPTNLTDEQKKQAAKAQKELMDKAIEEVTRKTVPAQPQSAPRRTIMPGSKVMIIDDMHNCYLELPKVAQPPAQTQQQREPQQRRVLLPSSKSGGFRE